MTFSDGLSFLLSLLSSDLLLSEAARRCNSHYNVKWKNLCLIPLWTNCKSSVNSDESTGSKHLVSSWLPRPKLELVLSRCLYFSYDWLRVSSFKATSPDHPRRTDSCRPAATPQPSAFIHHRTPGLHAAALSRVAPYHK